MIPANPFAPSGLSDLEKSGVLMTRMLHELNNQLSVVAGHLQIIQLSKRDPESLAQSWREIRTASDTIGGIVERYVGFRRQIHNGAGVCSLNDVIGAVVEGASEVFPADGAVPWKWKLSVSAEYPGQLHLEPRWIKYAVWQTVLLSQSQEGQIVIFPPGSDFDARGLKPASPLTGQTDYLHLLVSWPAEKPAYTDQDLFCPQVMAMALVVGIVRWAHGLANYAFVPPNQSRFWISLPIRKRA
jgi:hypothetical protein